MNPEQLKQWLDEGKITPEVYLSLLNQPQTNQENSGNQGSVSLNTTGDATIGNINIHNYAASQEIPTPAVDDNALLANYLKHLISENRYLQLYGIRSGGNNTPVELEKIYITLRATRQANRHLEEKWLRDEMQFAPGERGRLPSFSSTEVVSVNEALRSHSFLVVLGDPGSGKTTLLRYLTLLYGRDLAQNSGEVQSKLHLKESGLLPIFLPLRDIGRYVQKQADNPTTTGQEGHLQLLECLLAKLKSERLEIPLTFFDPYLETGRVVILLDGLDEVADPELRRRVARLVEALARKYPNCRYVVTSRIKGYDGSARLQGEFVTSTVRDFSLEDIHLFLTHWHQVAAVNQHGRGEYATRQASLKTENLLQAIQANPRIQELAINPLLLTIIALAYEDKKLPDRRVELYEEAVAVFVANWNEAKGVTEFLQVNQREFDALDRRLLLQRLALHLQEQEMKEIELADLRRWLMGYFKEIVTSPQELPKVVERFLEAVELRTGLLAARGVGVYSFSHLTFQEYLAAVEISGRDDYLDYVLARCGQSWWREVVLLVAGRLCEGGITRPTNLISAIAKHPDEPEPHYNLVLAADCLRDCEGRVSSELRAWLPRHMRDVIETPFPQIGARWVSYRGNVVMGLVRLGEGFWSQPYGEPEWVEIPAGAFIMGYDMWNNYEKPAHQRTLEPFLIARVPTTNAQYLLFVQATGHSVPKYWENNRPPKGKEGHPVVQVSWDDAMAYCSWLSQVTGKQITLPTEAQWEKAARGTDGRVYPWGNSFDRLKCNSSELFGIGGGDTTPVGIFPAGASPYGVLEMAGNVWEWTSSEYTSAYASIAVEVSQSVLRGGSLVSDGENLCSSNRIGFNMGYQSKDVGFRCVWNLG